MRKMVLSWNNAPRRGRRSQVIGEAYQSRGRPTHATLPASWKMLYSLLSSHLPTITSSAHPPFL